MNEIESREWQKWLTPLGRDLRLEKGTYLFQEGEKADDIYYIQSGKIQISKMDMDGRELALRICSEGDLIGELTLFCPGARYMLTAKALEDSVVSAIPRERLEQELANNPTLAIELMKWMSVHFRKTQTKFRDLILHGKKRSALFNAHPSVQQLRRDERRRHFDRRAADEPRARQLLRHRP